MGIQLFDKRFRSPIYSIYGFVRFADEIVDTFHAYDKSLLLDRFRADTYEAIDKGISLNPVLHAFQQTVNKYHIRQDLIDAFLHSMSMDLKHENYAENAYKEYIYGSAEVVGLMCLKVFCEGNDALFNQLESAARSLGSAFQKINFLRDIRSDFEDRGRVYFPEVDFNTFSHNDKVRIEADIKADFEFAYSGIVRLPKGVRFGVYLAYVYYTNLFNKIKKTTATKITKERIRVNGTRKAMLLCSSLVKNHFNLL